MVPVSVEKTYYEFNKEIPASTTVASGAHVKFVTCDCFGGQITMENFETALASKVFNWDTTNPASGPVKVEGAKPGDVLRVEILSIKAVGPCVIMTGKGIGANKEHFDSVVTRVLEIKDNHVVFSPDIRIPVEPMIGVIGTAPAGEPARNGWPGDHGGNMDCKLIKEGAAVYLPVAVEGGMLSLGDVHAVMGDGEVCGTGAECPAEVLVKVELLKGCKFPTPFIENGTHYAAVASQGTLDEAADRAVKNGVDFLMGEYGMSRYDAITFCSLAADVRICQIVDPLMTARLEIPKKYLAALKKG